MVQYLLYFLTLQPIVVVLNRLLLNLEKRQDFGCFACVEGQYLVLCWLALELDHLGDLIYCVLSRHQGPTAVELKD